MTRKEFQTLTRERIIYLDGATGSNLVKAGMPSGVCPEQWILEHKDVFLELQKAYVNAGSDILYTPTFGANRVKLKEYGLQGQIKEMIAGLVSLSKQAAASAEGRKVYVAGDLTMTGEQLAPIGMMELEELIDIYKEQISCLKEAGVDLLVIETMMSLAETRAALIAAREVCDLPVMVTMSFEPSGKTLFGTDARTAAIVAESLGADAVGINCSAGPVAMRGIVAAMAAVTRIPLIAKPNAGLPTLDASGKTCYDMSAAEFAEEMELLVEAGATVLGGCCGTAPEYIAALHAKFSENAAGTDTSATCAYKKALQVDRCPAGKHFVTSQCMTVEFGLDDPVLIIGERINPTGNEELQESLLDDDLDTVLELAEDQEDDGACILDVNLGMSGIDEKEMMLRAIDEISFVTNLPLSLDSVSAEVLEAALRRYPGRALINSITLEAEKIEKLLPLAVKYGAMFVLMPLSDKGLPQDFEERKQIIQKIYGKALELGMSKDDMVVDGLVTAVSTNRKAALEALETIQYCKENGFATVCGLSNISYGMPKRSMINAAFMQLARKSGLNLAIANPGQELNEVNEFAMDLLMDKEDAALKYIEYTKTL